MKIDKLQKALAVCADYGLDSVDLSILAEIAVKHLGKEDATIMQFSSGRPYASFGTIHARVKRMVKKGFLVKKIKEDNQKYKLLEDGPKMQELMEKLNKVG
jgi:DNA-binding HxlR family transcriptional regulator